MRIVALLLVTGLGLVLFGLFAITRARPCPTESCGIDLNSNALGLRVFILVLGGAAAILVFASLWRRRRRTPRGRSQVNNATSTTSSQDRTDRVEVEGCIIDTETSAGG